MTEKFISFSPKSNLGQNFLIDSNIAARIVKYASITAEDVILEVGPGKGILTRELLASDCSRLYSVELDRRLSPFLEPIVETAPRLTLIWGDAVRFDYSEISSEPPNKLVANLPYNITTPLLWKLLEDLAPIGLNRFIIMVQRESADRICAPPGTKQRYPLGITIQIMGTAKKLMKVSPQSFRPIPAVDSVVMEIRLSSSFELPGNAGWRRLLRTGFSQRRKTLVNNLLSGGYPLSRTDMEDIFTEKGIRTSIRAEALTCDEWLSLHREIEGKIK